MRETRTSGVTRGERVDGAGMRLLRHARGNPDTELCRSLHALYQLPYSTVATHPPSQLFYATKAMTEPRDRHGKNSF